MYIYIYIYIHVYTNMYYIYVCVYNLHRRVCVHNTHTQVGHLERLLHQLSLRDQALGDMVRLDNPLAATNSGGNDHVYRCIYMHT